MVTQIKTDTQAQWVDGVDRHYYEKQVGAANPFDDKYQFKLAAARAKDKARHEMIRAVRNAAQDARERRGVGQELGDILSGRQATSEKRWVDGVEGAPDDAIKL